MIVLVLFMVSVRTGTKKLTLRKDFLLDFLLDFELAERMWKERPLSQRERSLEVTTTTDVAPQT
ncbi:MAG: hypothetical protein ACREUU_05185 [Gammaproteobacteria bacterium]